MRHLRERARPVDDASPEAPWRLGRIPAAVWAITALHGCLLLLYAVIVPLYQAPDEPAHLDLSLKLRERASYPAGDDGGYHDAAVIRSVEIANNLDEGAASPPECPNCPVSLRRVMMPAEEMPADAAPPRDERPSFRALGFGSEQSENLNLAWQHPPLYYTVEATLLTALAPFASYGDDWSFDVVVGLLRLSNALMVLPLPLLAYAAAAMLGARRQAAVAASALPLAISQLTHIGSTVNNDNLLVLLAGLLTVLMARVASGDTGRGTAVAAGVVAGLGMLTKAFGLFALGWLPAVYAVAWIRGRRTASVVRAAGLSLACALVVGGWWWARNLLTTGSVQPLAREQPEPPEGFVPSVVEWHSSFRSSLSRTFWGHFGWLDRQLDLPGVVTTSMTLLVVAVTVAGLVVLALRRDRRFAGLLLLLLPLAGIGCLLAYGSWSIFADSGRIRGTQGRYLFPSVAALAAAVGVAIDALARRWSRVAPLAVLAVAFAMHLLSVPRILLRFWGPEGGDSLRASAGAMLAWSPWPRGLVLLVLAVALGLSLLLGVLVARMALAADEGAGGEQSGPPAQGRGASSDLQRAGSSAYRKPES